MVFFVFFFVFFFFEHKKLSTEEEAKKMASSLRSVNPNAESMDKAAALFMNINAAKGLQDVMKTNLGPRGTIKMLVDGAGGIQRHCHHHLSIAFSSA